MIPRKLLKGLQTVLTPESSGASRASPQLGWPFWNTEGHRLGKVGEWRAEYLLAICTQCSQAPSDYQDERGTGVHSAQKWASSRPPPHPSAKLLLQPCWNQPDPKAMLSSPERVTLLRTEINVLLSAHGSRAKESQPCSGPDSELSRWPRRAVSEDSSS